MADDRGDVVTRKAIGILSPFIAGVSTNVFLDPDTDDCCFELLLLADILDPDPLKNDKTAFYNQYEQSVTAADMFLTSPSDPAFVDVPLVDDTYGTFKTYGFFVDGKLRKAVLYLFDWVKVLAIHGEGTYQAKITLTKIAGPPEDQFDFAYCLGNYTAEKADGTMFLKFTNKFTLGDRFRQDNNVTFPHPTFDDAGNVLNSLDGFTDGIRVDGRFGDPGSDFTVEETEFKDKSIHHTEMIRVDKFKMRIDFVTSVVNDKIAINFCQADLKTVTDYNQNAYKRFIETAVRLPNEFKPVIREESLQAYTEIEFEDRWNFGEKEFCD